ncbi:MAG: YfiR family protein [Nitrospirota bacterium]
MVILLCLLQSGGAFAADRTAEPLSEYQVKAAFVYNFIKFVTWPSGDDPADGRIRLCILGDLPDPAPFDQLDGQELMGRHLKVTYLRKPQEARACQVLYLASSLSSRLQEVLEAVRGRPVLTVSDTNGYAKRGVMINMYLENKRVRFEINAAAAGEARVRISAKLLNLAGTVHGKAGTGK